MNTYYMIGSTDGSERRFYYYAEEKNQAGLYATNILKGMKFASKDELLTYLSKHWSDFSLGVTIVKITDVTLKLLEDAEKALTNHTSTEEQRRLYYKYHNPAYITIA